LTLVNTKKIFIFANPKKGSGSMLIVNIKENESLDKALKKFKKKFERTGVVKELRERQAFTKPSIKKRKQLIKARYRQQMQRAEMA